MGVDLHGEWKNDLFDLCGMHGSGIAFVYRSFPMSVGSLLRRVKQLIYGRVASGFYPFSHSLHARIHILSSPFLV